MAEAEAVTPICQRPLHSVQGALAQSPSVHTVVVAIAPKLIEALQRLFLWRRLAPYHAQKQHPCPAAVIVHHQAHRAVANKSQ